jgi:hypothetical protein
VLSGTFVEAMGKRFHVDHFNCGKCKANIGAPPPPPPCAAAMLCHLSRSTLSH